MNNYMAVVILRPTIDETQIDFVQTKILNLFEPKTKVKKVWYLGKKKLDYSNKKYNKGHFIKIELTGKEKLIEEIREELRQNKDIIFSVIINNQSEQPKLPVLKMKKSNFYKNIQVNSLELNGHGKKVYLLISRNLKLPFAESNIIAISENKENIYQVANKKIQEYVYSKGYYTLKPFKIIKEVENEFRKTGKVQFALEKNPNLGQELLIQEKYLI